LNTEKINYKFIYYLFCFQHSNQIFDYVDKAHPSVIKKRYFVPTIDVAEQLSIANILSKTDQAIAQTEAIIAKYTLVKTGLMQDLLTKGIDENGNIRTEQNHEFKDSPLGRIPKEWDVKKMGDLMLAIDPQPDHRTPPAFIDGVPYVGISDFVSNGEIDIKNCRKVGFNVLGKQRNSFTIELGDLIFGKIGTIGKPKILPDFNKLHFTLSANVILIKPIECPDFIYWTLVSDYISNQVSLAIHSTSQPAFGMEKIRDLNVLTPKPEERYRITEKLKKIDELFSKEHIKLSKLQSLKMGLMQDLLTGKVRVKI
jgi:type I restriction enzyme S subunit